MPTQRSLDRWEVFKLLIMVTGFVGVFVQAGHWWGLKDSEQASMERLVRQIEDQVLPQMSALDRRVSRIEWQMEHEHPTR